MGTKQKLQEICATMRLEGMYLPQNTQLLIYDVLDGTMSEDEARKAIIRKYMQNTRKTVENHV